jgi:cytochrome c peroxidase
VSTSVAPASARAKCRRGRVTFQVGWSGNFEGLILRGLAARAPYFHNGSAATLSEAVEFYDQRFNVGFTDEEKQHLANFLGTL